ncbi:hypothetical protein Hanom_Chr12g01090781 [Helianthus anomalus]
MMFIDSIWWVLFDLLMMFIDSIWGGRWWRSGGGRRRWWQGRWWQDVGVEVWKKSQEEVCVCVVKTWEHVCVVKRSRRPFLMKGLRENKQSAASKCLPASARRRHKWPEVLLAKKQTGPNF